MELRLTARARGAGLGAVSGLSRGFGQEALLERYVVYAVVFAVLAVATGLLAIIPAASKVSLARESYRQSQLVAVSYLGILRQRDSLQKRVGDLEAELSFAEKTLWHEDLTANLLADITSLAHVTGVSLVRFAPGEVTAGGDKAFPEGYVFMPFDFVLKGTLGQIKGFLTLLGGQGQPVRVTSFALSSAPVRQDKQSNTAPVMATLTASFHAEALARQKPLREGRVGL